MEKPDANGFINVNWPSTNVQYGGVFHTRIAQTSAEQQQFLKVLLEESKLTMAQRKKVSPEIPLEDKIVPEKNNSRPTVRPRTSRRRSLSTIRASEAIDDDQYCPPKRGVDREKLKERLANMMTYGDTDNEQKVAVSPKIDVKKVPKLPTSKEMKQELINQICDRMKWLAEMDYLGQAEPHKRIINDQITERIRALDALGVESECSSAKSTDSGFSTTRSREQLPLRKPTSKTAAGSARIQTKGVTTRVRSGSKRNEEENVASYSRLPSLQCSPRRRV